jgi:hypothetical protein
MSKDDDKVLEFSERLIELLETFADETAGIHDMFVQIGSQVDHIREDTDYLTKIVRDGNGQPPLLTRQAIVEEKLSQYEKAGNKSRELIVAMVTSAIALFASVIAIL